VDHAGKHWGTGARGGRGKRFYRLGEKRSETIFACWCPGKRLGEWEKFLQGFPRKFRWENPVKTQKGPKTFSQKGGDNPSSIGKRLGGRKSGDKGPGGGEDTLKSRKEKQRPLGSPRIVRWLLEDGRGKGASKSTFLGGGGK